MPTKIYTICRSVVILKVVVKVGTIIVCWQIMACHIIILYTVSNELWPNKSNVTKIDKRILIKLLLI